MQTTRKYKFPSDATVVNTTLGTESSIESLIRSAATNSKAKVDANEVHDSQRVMQVRFTSKESELQFKLSCPDLVKYLVE